MRLVSIRKDVWLEQIAADGGWEGIEDDLPERRDCPLVLLWSTKGERLVRGIFHRMETLIPTLRATAIGVSELDPEWFKPYARQRTPDNKVNVAIYGETQMRGLEPSFLCIYDPNKDQDTPYYGNIDLKPTQPADIGRVVSDVLEKLEPPLIYITNPSGLPLSNLIVWLETQTPYLVDSRTYTISGE